LESWQAREEFSEAYFKQRLDQFKREGWPILADSPEWFVGYIPPGSYPSIVPGLEYFTEIRIRDWPLTLYGNAIEWDTFFNSGWMTFQQGLSGKALLRAMAVLAEVETVLPNTAAIFSAIRKKQLTTIRNRN
jgi:hypothetical protein